MPKLTQKTLEKRFQCPFCGETTRTRNGLSGHIQFKHASGVQPSKQAEEKGFQIEPDQVTRVALQKKLSALIGQALIDEDVEEANIKADWFLISDFLKGQKIVLNKADYKSYLIFALAMSFGNQRLMNKLRSLPR
jgi:hypothetical protein